MIKPWVKWIIVSYAIIAVWYFAGMVFIVDARPELVDVFVGALFAIIGLIMAIGRRPYAEAKLFEARLLRRALHLKDARYAANDGSMVKSMSIVYLISGVMVMSLGFYFIMDSIWRNSL